MKNDQLPPIPSRQELAKFADSGLIQAEQAKTVNQYGDGSVSANTIQTVIVQQQITPIMGPQYGRRPSKTNTDFFNLFVVGDEDLDRGRFIMDKSRSLTKGSVNDEVFERFSGLSPEAIEDIKTFPSIFANENTAYSGKTDPEQLCYYGFVKEIKVQDNGIKIYFTPTCQIRQQKIMDLWQELDFSRVGVTTLNRTHWIIKQINLDEVLEDAGIPKSALPTY